MDDNTHRILPFRCARTGGSFIVIFTKPESAKLHKIIDIIPKQPAKPTKTIVTTPPQLKSPLETAIAAVVRPIVSLPRWLSTFLELGEIEWGAVRPRKQNIAPPQDDEDDFDINEFDFTGWYCPHCNHGKQPPYQHRFIRCGRCGELVCASRLEKLSANEYSFTCYDDCGNSSILGTGVIKSVGGRGYGPRPEQLARPAGGHPLPPGKPVPPGRPKLPSGSKK